MRGRGKTNSIKNDFKDVSPLFIIDIRNEYENIFCFRSFQAFQVEMAKLYFRRPSVFDGKPIQCRFAFNSSNDYVKVFNFLKNFTDCTIIVDEADALFSVREYQKPLIDIFLGSRNLGVSMVFAGKRPFLFPILVRSQADKFYIFGTEEDRDIKYLERRLRQDFPKDPFKLKQGECIIWESGEKPTLKQYPLFKPKENVTNA